VCDVVLPHINGRKLVGIARASRPDLKVLFVSGYAENATLRGDFLDAGMGMLRKPFALEFPEVRTNDEPVRAKSPNPSLPERKMISAGNIRSATRFDFTKP
jgi:DNA-binding response OmpR family regulator